MRKKLLILIALASSSLYAAEWGLQGFQVVNSQKDSTDVTTDFLKTSEGEELQVTYTGELKETTKGIIAKLNSDFRAWKTMKLETIKFSVNDSEIQVLVSPREYNIDGKNALDYISTGLLFTYRGNLIYNFRIRVDNLFVPIKGIFIDEKSFNEKLLSAVNDPQTYVNARDPDYLLEKLDRTYVEFERLRVFTLSYYNGGKPVEKEILDEVLKIKSENPAFTWKEISDVTKERKLKISANLIKVIMAVYYGEY